MTTHARVGLAGAVATGLAAFALWPLFETKTFLVTAWAVVALVALTGMALRSLRLPRPLVPLGQLLVLLEAFLLATAAEAMGYLLVPTPTALTGLGDTIVEGFLAIARYAPPAPEDPALVLIAVGGIALVAVAVDALAATWRLVPWAGLPLLATYAIPAGIVRGGLAWYLFVPVAAGYVALLVAEARGRVARWGRPVVGSSSRRGPLVHTGALSATGRRVGGVVIAGAVVVPAILPSLPEGVFTAGGSGEGSGGGRIINTDNPIVDLRRDLVRPDDVAVLRYRSSSERPDYIRLVALDEYDGRQWRAARRSVPESQRVESGLPPAPGLTDSIARTEVRTSFRVTNNLDVQWLPLTYPTTSIQIDGDWRYASATLDVVGSDRRTAGAEYETTSLRIEPDPERLAAAGPAPDSLDPLTTVAPSAQDIVDQALATALARQDLPSRYEQAVAIQDWFREGFTYSTQRRAGNSDTALADFLADRSGYCEQYAATMALMARRLGIPTRVAVGFLPGNRVGDEWVVSANDAHAWPELYFEGAGWVRFEPTPPDRTGRAPSWTVPVPQATGSATSPGPTSTASATGGALPRDRAPDGAPVGGSGTPDEPVPWGRLALLTLAALALTLTPAAATVAGSRRWALAAGDPARSAEAAWADLRDAVRDRRGTWDPALTPRRASEVLAKQARLPTAAREALTRMATALERARYAPRPEETQGLRDDASTVRAALLDGRPLRVRLAARLLPVAGRDALARLVGVGGSALDAAELAGHRVREHLPLSSRQR